MTNYEFTQRLWVLEQTSGNDASMHLFHMQHQLLVEDLEKEPDDDVRLGYCIRLLKVLNRQLSFAQGRLQVYEKAVQVAYEKRMQ
jgi:hypothetical protein